MKEKLTYEQAVEKALTTEWVASPCHQGEECWCRIIEPNEPILFGENDEEYYIVGSGSIPKLEAEHLVELHNKSLPFCTCKKENPYQLTKEEQENIKNIDNAFDELFKESKWDSKQV